MARNEQAVAADAFFAAAFQTRKRRMYGWCSVCTGRLDVRIARIYGHLYVGVRVFGSIEIRTRTYNP